MSVFCKISIHRPAFALILSLLVSTGCGGGSSKAGGGEGGSGGTAGSGGDGGGEGGGGTGGIEPGVVTSLEVEPSRQTLMVGRSLQLAATAFDELGEVSEDVDLVWTSSDSGVAKVNSNGLVTAKVPGKVTISVKLEGIDGVEGSSEITVETDPLDKITIVFAGDRDIPLGEKLALYALPMDADGGLLPNREEATWISRNPEVATIDKNGLLTAVSVGVVEIETRLEGKMATAIFGAVLRFVEVQPDAFTTCGLTTSGAAYCWGQGSNGLLGNGTSDTSFLPVPVSGGHIFTALAFGNFHRCGVTVEKEVWCWGSNYYGRLGQGAVSDQSFEVPVKVVGDHEFVAIAASSNASCALDSDGAAWCWGDGEPTPQMVEADKPFLSIKMAPDHRCASTSTKLWCWGKNIDGMILPAEPASNVYANPVVAEDMSVPGRSIVAYSVSSRNTCATVVSLVASTTSCWGSAAGGARGNGSTTQTNKKERVLGEHNFVSLSSSGQQTCGVTADGEGWCWGSNGYGQGGQGSTIPADLLQPARVKGLKFKSIKAGSISTCGVALDGYAYCWGYSVWKNLGYETDGTPVLTPTRVSLQHFDLP